MRRAARDELEHADRKARHDRLVAVHGKVLTLILHESRFVLDRTNTYLVTTSFLLAAYGVSLSVRNVLGLLIPVIGIALSALHPLMMARTIRALEFWRSTGALVEADPDYWFPAKVETDDRSDVDLDFLLARQRRNAGLPVRQETVDMRMGRPPGFVMRLTSRVPDPNTVFSTWIPTFVGALWVLALALAATTVDITSPAGDVDRGPAVEVVVPTPSTTGP